MARLDFQNEFPASKDAPAHLKNERTKNVVMMMMMNKMRDTLQILHSSCSFVSSKHRTSTIDITMASTSPSRISTTISPKQSPMSISALSVSELSDRLLERFDGDKDKTVDFLRQCQTAVEQKGTAQSTVEPVDLGDALLQEPIVLSMISSRGKVSLAFFEGTIVATDVKTSLEAWRLPANQVLQIVVFPKPEDCKKPLAKKS
eukprot:scaffold37222_cov221-Amphora_coffeaeformis.AAC.1